MLVIFGAVVLVLALMLENLTMEKATESGTSSESWTESIEAGQQPSNTESVESDGTMRYKGGIYTADGSTLLSWSLEDAIEDGCVFEYDPYTLRPGHFYHLLVDTDTFHPNLKYIRNELSANNTYVTMIVPWGVTDIEDGTFYDITCYLPPTAVNITREAFRHSPSSETKCISSRYIETIVWDTGIGPGEWEERSKWYEIYDVPLNGWKIVKGLIYRFAKDPYCSMDMPAMLTGTQEVDGVTLHFAKTGELLSAELPEGEYDLDGIKILVDGAGKVTLIE